MMFIKIIQYIKDEKVLFLSGIIFFIMLTVMIIQLSFKSESSYTNSDIDTDIYAMFNEEKPAFEYSTDEQNNEYSYEIEQFENQADTDRRPNNPNNNDNTKYSYNVDYELVSGVKNPEKSNSKKYYYELKSSSAVSLKTKSNAFISKQTSSNFEHNTVFDNPYKDWIDEGEYTVGHNLKAGEYFLLPKNNYEASFIISENKNNTSKNFKHAIYLLLTDGTKVVFNNCYINFANNIDREKLPSQRNMYKIGVDITPGVYIINPIRITRLEIYKQPSFHEKDLIHIATVPANSDYELQEGWYVYTTSNELFLKK